MERSETPQESPEQTFNIDGENISVKVNKEVRPNVEGFKDDEAVIFLPGWSAGTAKTLNYLTERFAEDNKSAAYSLATRPEHVIGDSLYQEARAVSEWSKARKFKKVIMVGHSEGGPKAINLIDILQKENTDIQVAGLILLDSVGLYEQGAGEIAAKFAWDTLVKTPKTIAANVFKNPSLIVKGLQASTDIIFNIAREIKRSGVDYPNRLVNQIKEMSAKNTHLADVKCPVVLIQGAEDPVSSPKRIIPRAEDRRLWSTRRKFLKEVFFPSAEDISMLTPSRIGHHGLPHFRSEQISKAALYLLNRHKESRLVIDQASLS